MTAEDRAEAIRCRHCEAEVDQSCKTPAGRKCGAHLPRRRAFQRRMREAGTLPRGDSPLIRAALAEADARDRLDHT